MAGVLVEVVHLTPQLEKRIEQLYGHFLGSAGTETAPHLSTFPRVTVEVRHGSGKPPSPPPEPTGWMVADRPMWGQFDDDCFIVSDGRTAGRVDYAGRRAELELFQTDEAALFVATHRIFPIAVSELLRLEQRYSLHGGAIASGQGGGLLLLGDSEAGKSTLVYSALAAGYLYVADDGLLVEQRPDKLVVHPFYREFTVDPEILAPEDRCRTAPAERAPGFAKVRLELEARQVAPHCRPVAIAILRRTEEPGFRLEPGSPTAALEELVKQEPRILLYPPLAEQGLQTLVNLTVTSKVYILYNCGYDFDRKNFFDQCLN
jgi:hypothetical protein